MEGTSAAGAAGGGAGGAGSSGAAAGGAPDQQQQRVVERLNPAVEQQLNLQSVKARAISLDKTISRILEEFDAYARANAEPKWQDVLGQFSMVNMELFNIMEDVKKVSKAFVVHPKFVNAENATILPVMLSSKSLPEMEAEHNLLREQLLQGMQHLPVNQQIEKLKARNDMIGAACDSAEKIIADMRKAYGLGTRQGPAIAPTLDKAQAAKIHEQEKLLRAAVNTGQGLQIPADQRQFPATLPKHLQDVLIVGDNAQGFTDSSGILPKSTQPLMSSNTANSQGSALQAAGAQFGRSVPSPSGGAMSFDNTTTSPLPYANSPRSGTNMMNAPSPQQQQLQQQQQQQQQQQRQKMMQVPHQQQLLAQQQFRQSSTQGLGQVQHQMQYSQPLAHQQFQSRQLPSGQIQHTLGQSQVNQLTQGSQLRNHLNQFAGANSALYNTAQSSSNSQMIPNISAAMASQSLLPRMQFALPGGHSLRSHASQMLSDQMFSMGATNPGSMMPVQQQQQQQQTLGAQGGFGSMAANVQNLQSGVLPMQNTSQIPNFQQQRQQNQQNQQ